MNSCYSKTGSLWPYLYIISGNGRVQNTSLSLSHMYTFAHTHYHSHTLSLSLLHSLSLSHIHTFAHTHYHSHTHSLSHSYTHSLSLTHTHALAHSSRKRDRVRIPPTPKKFTHLMPRRTRDDDSLMKVQIRKKCAKFLRWITKEQEKSKLIMC